MATLDYLRRQAECTEAAIVFEEDRIKRRQMRAELADLYRTIEEQERREHRRGAIRQA